jgi:branched-chain amino acid aminotransferase
MTQAPRYGWLDGRVVDWADACLHVDTQCVLGGLNAYEVVGAFRSRAGDNLYFFRLYEHLQRLRLSAKVMRLALPYADEELGAAARRLVAMNGFREDVGVRIVAYFGAGPVFSYRPEEITTGVFMVAKAATTGRRPEGLHVCTSGWQRLPDIAAPPRVKAGANYHNVRLAQIQAKVDGYDDAILTSVAGKVCELPLANVFLVRSGVVVTPDVASGILEGITRQAILDLGRAMGITVVERPVDRSELYAADEVFATTTLVGVTPIVSIDRYPVGSGAPGPLTVRLGKALDDAVRNPAHTRWATPVYDAGDVS